MIYRTRSLLLVLLVVGVVLTSLIGLTYIPNPLSKRYPWVSIDYVRIHSFNVGFWFTSYSMTYFLALISIHNPTHQNYHIELIVATLDARLFSNASGLELGRYYSEARELGILTENESANVVSAELQACTTIWGWLDFRYYQSLSVPINKGVFHLNLTLNINGRLAYLADDLTTNFVSVPEQTTTATTATSTRTGLPPKPYECLLPWV